MVDSDPLFYVFALVLIVIEVIYHLVRIKLRLPVGILKTGEMLKYVILPAIIFSAIFIGSVTYLETRYDIDSPSSTYY